ncbi:undecaprenyl-phosphate 4-deoxy-4-formamido-L-arabinose transferase [Fibrobacter sp. UWR3]|uniref:glycosyltransferase family 2 protein n=1 Tax=Fibrobacter sp. UWR3 TaxID=1896217 RepID=UPI000916E642|nr:glycosyltransferase family 2 protein [Fibrobacter sp. UWR3]SHM54973.1 undecaprenyl-phosphate 4-deoxy-4-formamido-L-arabinose transferase [Fibrobacter sp. UWR3]
MKLSFVIPCYRSENTIGTVVQEIRDTIATRSGTDYEIVLVNDCSPDNVWQVIKQLAAEDCHIKGICLAKNFGQHSALMAGYGQTTGDYVISLDDDGQTPANECFKLVDKLEEGFDVVYACHVKSTQKVYRRFGSFINRKMAESLIGQPQNLRASSFFIARKFVIDQITQYQNSFPYIGGLIFRTTKKIGSVEIQHRKRILGESNYTLMSLLSLWINGFTAFSVKPLRLATYIGVLCAVLGLGSGIYIVIQKIMMPEMLMGYASIMSTMLFLGGMIMLILGLIGEYIGRIYICINQAPQYVIREKV